MRCSRATRKRWGVSMRLIDADELIERMRRNRLHSVDVPFIKSQNPVDAVRVVQSSWDYGETGPEPDENNNVQANCRNCGAGDTHASRMINKVPYCWKCGAKMEVK